MKTKIDIKSKKIIKAKDKNNINISNNEVLLLNLDFKTEEKTINDILITYGEINSIKILKKNNKSKGKAFVIFKNEESIKKILKSEIIIDERVIIIKYKEKIISKNKFSNTENNESRFVILKNLSYDSTEDDLNEIFNKNKEVKELRIIKDKFNKSKGYGFIEFNNVEDSILCKELSPYIINNRKVFIDFSKNNKLN